MFIIKINNITYLRTFGYSQREPDEVLGTTHCITKAKTFNTAEEAEDFFLQHKERRVFLKENKVDNLSIEMLKSESVQKIPC